MPRSLTPSEAADLARNPWLLVFKPECFLRFEDGKVIEERTEPAWMNRVVVEERAGR